MSPCRGRRVHLNDIKTSSFTVLSSAFVETVEITMCRATRGESQSVQSALFAPWPRRLEIEFGRHSPALQKWATWEVGPDTHREPTQGCAESGLQGQKPSFVGHALHAD
jgi:hypothetical protein